MIKSNSITKIKGLSDKLQREIALGMHCIKAFGNNDSICRWLDDGEEIEFSSANIGNYNGEFNINGEDHRKMWYSQFSGVYLNPNDLTSAAISTITLKNGGEKPIRKMGAYSFWKTVQGKRFRVSIDKEHLIVIDPWNEKVKELNTVRNIIDYISTNLDKENYGAVRGMTKTSRLYSLTEI